MPSPNKIAGNTGLAFATVSVSGPTSGSISADVSGRFVAGAYDDGSSIGGGLNIIAGCVPTRSFVATDFHEKVEDQIVNPSLILQSA